MRPSHLITLVKSLASISDESELTLSFPLMLQIQRIMLWLLLHVGFMVSVVMACVSDGCSITLFTHVEFIQRQLVDGLLPIHLLKFEHAFPHCTNHNNAPAVLGLYQGLGQKSISLLCTTTQRFISCQETEKCQK